MVVAYLSSVSTGTILPFAVSGGGKLSDVTDAGLFWTAGLLTIAFFTLVGIFFAIEVIRSRKSRKERKRKAHGEAKMAGKDEGAVH